MIASQISRSAASSLGCGCLASPAQKRDHERRQHEGAGGGDESGAAAVGEVADVAAEADREADDRVVGLRGFKISVRVHAAAR
jgi:hypothetical protein